MSNETLHSVRPSFATLIMGLLADVRALVLLELSLAKHELQVEIGKTVKALLWCGLGVGFAVLGTISLMLMLVHALHAGTPLPLWACYGLVGSAFAGLGWMLCAKGIEALGALHLLPLRTLRSIKANTLWIKHRIASSKT